MSEGQPEQFVKAVADGADHVVLEVTALRAMTSYGSLPENRPGNLRSTAGGLKDRFSSAGSSLRERFLQHFEGRAQGLVGHCAQLL